MKDPLPPLFPVSGTSYGVDFDTKSRQFRVPIVRKDELLRRGGNYIEVYVPPSITLENGEELVLVTHAVRDLYYLEEVGQAVVPANERNMPIFPVEARQENQRSFQDGRYSLVHSSLLARRGLMSLVGQTPLVTLSLKSNEAPLQYHVVSHGLVEEHELPVFAVFNIPALNANGPYPLKVNKGEHFAIPPKPVEFSTGAKVGKGLFVGAVALFVVAGLVFLYKKENKEEKEEEVDTRSKV